MKKGSRSLKIYFQINRQSRFVKHLKYFALMPKGFIFFIDFLIQLSLAAKPCSGLSPKTHTVLIDMFWICAEEQVILLVLFVALPTQEKLFLPTSPFGRFG